MIGPSHTPTDDQQPLYNYRIIITIGGTKVSCYRKAASEQEAIAHACMQVSGRKPDQDITNVEATLIGRAIAKAIVTRRALPAVEGVGVVTPSESDLVSLVPNDDATELVKEFKKERSRFERFMDRLFGK